MSTPESEAELLQLLQLLEDSRSTSYVAIGALTVLVFDHLLTLREEESQGHKWNVAKGLYLWNRYFSLAALSFDAFCAWYFPENLPRNDRPTSLRPPDRIGSSKPFIFNEHVNIEFQSCQAFLQVQGLAATIIVATVDVVLLLRVYVLYGNSKKMLMFLIPLVLCEVIPMAIISIFSDLPLKTFARFDGLHGCYALSVPRFLTFYTIPALAVSSIMFVLTLYKCGFAIIRTGIVSEMPVIRLFARDGIIWFIAVLLITSTDIIIWAAGRPTLAEVNIAMSCALYSIIASRVLLNIKTTLTKTANLTTASSWRNEETELQFMGTAGTRETF
ncbi:hypothetical protein K438DRAFT_2025805 [Mycena galopus ATCC 62051]|nr:hypothetical protein K438DRAFT_2025805 [Mycena galopus ATCC 62051]